MTVYAGRVIRRILAGYATHPAVIGFQVDNERGLELLHNRGVFQRFVDSLRNGYGDVESLNRAWGLVYRSHRLSTWADLWTPDGNAQPQHDVTAGNPSRDAGRPRVARPARRSGRAEVEDQRCVGPVSNH